MKLGEHVTDELRARMSAAQKGRRPSEACLIAAHKATAGHIMPEATRIALHEANTGKPRSPETRAKISVAHIGVKLSVEHCASMSEMMRQRCKLPEIRAMYSAKLKGKMGALSPSWKGGITPERQMIRTSEGYAIWRTTVFARDAFTCQKCGNVGGILRSHHMDCFADFPEKRMDANNGVTFCAGCHREFHHRYGTWHNRKWQTDEFLSEEQGNG